MTESFHFSEIYLREGIFKYIYYYIERFRMYLNKVVTDFGGSNRIILEID
jgi:hypothetical protein